MLLRRWRRTRRDRTFRWPVLAGSHLSTVRAHSSRRRSRHSYRCTCCRWEPARWRDEFPKQESIQGSESKGCGVSDWMCLNHENSLDCVQHRLEHSRVRRVTLLDFRNDDDVIFWLEEDHSYTFEDRKLTMCGSSVTVYENGEINAQTTRTQMSMKRRTPRIRKSFESLMAFRSIRMFVNIEWTLHVFENIAPKARVNPMQRVHVFT